MTDIIPENNNSEIIQIWLTTIEGDVLIKDISPEALSIHINEITIEGDSLKKVITDAESLWGILSTECDFKEIYSYCSENNENTKYKGYALKVRLDEEQSKIILDKYCGDFVNFNDLHDFLNKYKQDIDFKESFYSLLAWMDKVYGYVPAYKIAQPNL